MIICDSTLKSVEVKLAGSVATTELPFVAGYVSLSTDALTFVSAESDGTTNGATAVTVVSAPAASAQKQLKFLSVYNVDTASAAVTVQLNNNGTKRVIFTATLAVGYTLQYTDGEGFRVLDTAGAMSVLNTDGAILQSCITVIPNSQVLTLPNIPVSLVPAPGSGLALNLVMAVLRGNFATTAYSGASAAASWIVLTDTNGTTVSSFIANDSGASVPLAFLDTFLDNTNKVAVVLPQQDTSDVAEAWGILAVPQSAVTHENTGIQILASNGAVNFGGGNVANKLIATVYYTVEATA